MKLQFSLLLALAASATLLTAQQPDAPPSPPDAPKPPQGAQRPVAYIGVLTREMPAELRSQLSLPEGFGLLVEEVMPDSPAKKAGIKHHDVLVKLADQHLVNMEQLMALVRSKKNGEIVPLTVISNGKETQVNVTLAERMMSLNELRQPARGFPGMPQMQQFFGGGQDFREQMEQMQRQMREYQERSQDFRQQMDQVQRQMHEYQQRMQEWGREGHRGALPPMPPARREDTGREGDRRGAAAPGSGEARSEIRVESHATANIIRRDDSGEYQLKQEDGRRTFIVRPKDGEEQSWPVNTDAERQAVPEKFREKLRLFDHVHQDIRIEQHLRGPDAPHPPQGRAPSREDPPASPKGRETAI